MRVVVDTEAISNNIRGNLKTVKENVAGNINDAKAAAGKFLSKARDAIVPAVEVLKVHGAGIFQKEGINFCGKCGTNVEQYGHVNYCPVCGKRL